MDRMTYFNEDCKLKIQATWDIAREATDIRNNLLSATSVQAVLRNVGKRSSIDIH
jgi:hypothetical protein